MAGTRKFPGDDDKPRRRARDESGARTRVFDEQREIPDRRAARPLRPGSVLRKRFRIEKILGEGGMGTVFMATDLLKQEARDENVHVALKVLKEDLVDAELSFMGLQREARRAQQLAHPNIANVHDFDRADGVTYMTMELLRGQDLEELLRKHPHGLDNDQAHDITAQVCNGLAYAHGEGIVHADLKPQNIFVLASGRAKILDFGIAQAWKSGKVDHVETVFTGYSPAYASPQVLARERPTPADDVFSLGCVVYRMFTGAHPFNRLPAGKARLQGLKPRRHPVFKRAQWAAVRAALDFEARKRPRDAAEFLKRFAPNRIKQAAIGVSVASIAIAAALILFVRPDAGPEVPFEQLPAEVQVQITQNLESAELWLDGGDYNQALFFYDQVLHAHPRNPEGVEGMERTVGALVDYLRLSMAQEEISTSDALDAVDAMLSYESLPARSRRLAEKFRDAL